MSSVSETWLSSQYHGYTLRDGVSYYFCERWVHIVSSNKQHLEPCGTPNIKKNRADNIFSTEVTWAHPYKLVNNWIVTSCQTHRITSGRFHVGMWRVWLLFVLYTIPLSGILASHSVNHQLFADDTQLQKPTPPNDLRSLRRDLQLCTHDIKSWVCSNQLKLNEDKTEAILFRHFFRLLIADRHHHCWYSPDCILWQS